MANEPFDTKPTYSLMDTVLRSTSTIGSTRMVSRIATLAGIVIVLVYWRQTGGW